jgi:hypothetical protein
MLHKFLVVAVILLSILSSTSCFRIRTSLNRLHKGVRSLKAGIDVSGLPFDPIPQDLPTDSMASAFGTPSDLQNALILAAGLGYLAYEKRPRGSARDDLIEVRQSTIPGANLGVFAKKIIPEGTCIGRFPGFLMTAEDALKSSTCTSSIVPVLFVRVVH